MRYGLRYIHWRRPIFRDTGLFENAIDLDGDGGNDVAVGFYPRYWESKVKAGMLRGSGCRINWIRPNFQWKVASRPYRPFGDDMASMEVSMMKGVAYDLTFTGDGESYAFVIDSRFTQPPHDFQCVGLDHDSRCYWYIHTFADILNIFGRRRLGAGDYLCFSTLRNSSF